jgi:hypothetical protein
MVSTTSEAGAEAKPVETTPAEPTPATAEAGAADVSAPEPQPAKRGRKPGSTARKTRTVELTLTVTGTMEGEWQADIESVLDVARQQHQSRLAELEAELSKVKQALADLQD